MANTKYILEKVKIAGELEDLIAKSNGENVTVDYNGPKTLTEALAEILASVGNVVSETAIDQKIKKAIDDLVDEAPEAYNTLKEIAAYITSHEDAYQALLTASNNKLDSTAFETFKNSVEQLGTLAGKSEVAESDLSEALKTKIDNAANGSHTHGNKAELDLIKTGDVEKWNGKADKTPATAEADGLMSAADKKRFDGMGTVYYGASAPTEMKDGDLFIRVVSEG